MTVLERRLGPGAVLAVVIGALALAWALSQVIGGGKDDDPATRTAATATPTPCRPVSSAYGAAPDGFKYERADEKTRSKTVKALNLDERGGKVDMRLARRSGLTLGSIVGIPSQDPGGYVSGLVATAERAGAPVSKAKGYALLPLQGGTVVAAGVRGCRAILISAQDPNAVRYLAENVFSA